MERWQESLSLVALDEVGVTFGCPCVGADGRLIGVVMLLTFTFPAVTPVLPVWWNPSLTNVFVVSCDFGCFV